ncbi:MAG: hypothetical protein JJ900_15695 [Rhodospirillales bacterium]|nr:hypothetical protein [Rhodospirillales bacterium]MBO6788291.1 hypothetical protein [Rhodospirillales bacterium]
MNKIFSFLTCMAVLGLPHHTLAASLDLTMPLDEMARKAKGKLESSDLFVRCGGLYSGIHRHLDPLNLDKNQVAPYERSKIIVTHFAAKIRHEALLDESKDASQAEAVADEMIRQATLDVEQVSDFYMAEMQRVSASGVDVLATKMIRKDLFICRLITRSFAPDANRGTPGKLPKLPN